MSNSIFNSHIFSVKRKRDCRHTQTCTHTLIHTHVNIYIYIYLCMCVHASTQVHVCICAHKKTSKLYIYIYIYNSYWFNFKTQSLYISMKPMYVCMYVCIWVHTRLCAYVREYMCTCMYQDHMYVRIYAWMYAFTLLSYT